MMSLRINPLYLIFLLMIPAASETKWNVEYNQKQMCALKGSTVFINGSYTYPENLEVTEEFWITEDFNGPEDTPVFCKPPKDSDRVLCLVDDHQHFSFRLSDVRKEDEHEYRFIIKTNESSQKWLGDPVKITVTDLHVNSPPEFTEKEIAVLICTTSCSLTHSPTFIWYKNGRPLYSSTNQLHLQSVSSEDAGSYSCAVRGYEHLPSPAVTLTVRYPPKNVSVSISPSGEIVEGSSVTLTCSSDANPPVQNYTWFKEGGTSPVGSGQSYTITSSSSSSGWYYCEAQNEHGVQRSAPAEVTLKGHFIFLVASGVILCLVVVALIVLLMKRESLRGCKNQKRNTDEPAYEIFGFKS